MSGREQTQNRVLVGVTTAAAAFIHISISISQLFLGVGLLLAFIFRKRLEFPRIWIPLAAFFVWTVVADLVCPDPWTGRAQIKKMVLFLFIPLVYTVFVRQLAKAFYLLIAWIATASASALLGFEQFIQKYETARKTGENFYVTYVGHRITGFESHWMTFGALQLSVLCLVLAQLFFADRRLPPWVSWSSVAVLSVSILLGETRSIWLASVCAVLYLVWSWRPKMTLAVPVLVAVAFALAPSATRARLTSVVSPHGETDSNRHRLVTFSTGLRMIEAHPVFGIGPEQIGRQFDRYVPPDIKRPLPVGYYGHLHNIYVQYAAERGLPALAFILWAISLTVWDCERQILAGNKGRSLRLFLLHSTVAVTIAVLVGGLLEYNLGDSEVLMMFVSVVGLGYAAVAQNQVREPAAVISS
ncbi:MAG: O-antigen ligase family protein [Bryobacteraceae bacterium]